MKESITFIWSGDLSNQIDARREEIVNLITDPETDLKEDQLIIDLRKITHLTKDGLLLVCLAGDYFANLTIKASAWYRNDPTCRMVKALAICFNVEWS